MAGGSRRAGPADFRDQALALFLSARRTRASSEAFSPSSCSADATELLASPGLKPRLINADTASPACPVAWGRAAAAGPSARPPALSFRTEVHTSELQTILRIPYAP